MIETLSGPVGSTPSVTPAVAGGSRLVPLFNQAGAQDTLQVTANDNAWVDATNQNKGGISRTVAPAKFAASALRVIFGNWYHQVSFGEQYPDITNESTPSTPEGMYLSGNMCSFEHGGANRGLFTVGALDGTTRPFFDRTPRLSAAITRAIAAGDSVAIRHSVQDFRADQFVVFPLTRQSARFHNPGAGFSTDYQVIVNDTNQSITGTGTVTGTGNSCSCPIVLGVPTNVNQRSIITIGSSISVGDNWTALQGYASNAYEGAGSAFDFAAVAAGIPYINMGSSGDAVLDYFSVPSRQLSVFPQRFSFRRQVIEIVRPTDMFWSFGVNEINRVSSGFNVEQAVAVFREMALRVALIAYSVGARLWAFQEPLQTTWTGGGTAWDVNLSETAFMAGQTPALDGIAAGYNYQGLTGLSAFRKRVFDEIALEFARLASIGHAGAYICDPWVGNGRVQKVRGDGRLAYIQQNNAALSTVEQPTRNGDGTHPFMAATWNTSQLIASVIGTPLQTSGFPASGALVV